ncbi:MAG TPA: tetratricopeptide repeat protein [Desulfuromonadaceae bacterium]
MILELQPPLVALLASITGVERVIAKSGIPPHTDFHVPLLSLPHLFRTTLTTIPVEVPYLAPPKDLVERWRAKLAGASAVRRIGLVWAGKPKPYPNRSCPAEYLAPLFGLDGIRFYSLQIGERDRLPLPPELAAQVVDLTGGITDFADTAALIVNLDLVITIDTAVAHLAGALGTPVWVILPKLADWRWLEGRDDSPWYPSMRLFRQEQSGDWPSAVAAVARALQEWPADGAAAPDDAESIFQAAMAYLAQDAFDDAIFQFRKLTMLVPDDPAVWFNLGRAYLGKGNNADAEQCFRQVLLLKPDSPDAWLRLGRLCRERRAFEEAATYLRKAHELVPNSIDILFELGSALIPLEKTTDAFDCCRKILAIRPGCVEAYYNMGYLQLRSGDYLAGFANFEARLGMETLQIDLRTYPQPRWDGSPLEGRSILVYGEQGMGDAIQFSRYLPLVAERGGKIIFEVDGPLVPLFSNSFAGVAQVVPKSATPPMTDVYIQSLSLPYIFRTTIETVPDRIPYLVADASKASVWQRKLAGDQAFRVGLVWRGNPLNPLDRDRSTSLQTFLPLADIAGISLYSLQVGPAADEVLSLPERMGITDFTAGLHDLSDTAALIANLDLVIGIDTAVVHLAGALGKPAWLLLAAVPDWRWLVGRDDSPWYPTMRLFRQEQPGDWNGVVAAVARALREWLADGAAAPGDAESIFQAAMAYLAQDACDAAIFQFRKLLMLVPDDPAVWFNLGRAYLGKETVIRWGNNIQILGRAYLNKEHSADAEQCFRQVLLLKPDSPDALLRLGRLCREEQAVEEAEEYLRKAYELVPASVDIMLELGTVLMPQGKRTEAFELYRKILAIKPDCKEAIANVAYLQLSSGDYLFGFANFEVRLAIEEFRIDPRTYPQPRWDGAPLGGKSILVYGEQGMGDVIMFARYLPHVAERGGRVILEVDRSLTPLFASFPGVAQVVEKSATPPSTDLYIQLSSLPHIFRTTVDSIPNSIPYLTADPSKASAWQRKLAGDQAFRVGLVWRGNPLNPLDRDRSTSLQTFLPLADIAGVSLYSLQVGSAADEVLSLPAGMGITDFTAGLHDLSDTAALIANLDLVIGIDTAVVHLAGALGKPVWVVLSFVPCWRYMLNRDNSPWYPTMRLFRQERPGEWGRAVERVKNALELLLCERTG